jgi:hypothetical protein
VQRFRGLAVNGYDGRHRTWYFFHDTSPTGHNEFASSGYCAQPLYYATLKISILRIVFLFFVPVGQMRGVGANAHLGLKKLSIARDEKAIGPILKKGVCRSVR